MRLITYVLFLCSAFGSRIALADMRQCAGVPFGDPGAVGVMRVAPNAARVNFVADQSDKQRSCPSASAACQLRAFVVAGDLVLVENGGDDPFVCATFVNAKGNDTSGFLPRASLSPEASAANPKPTDWAGSWQRVEAEIKLKARGATVEANGEATWGSGDPDRVKRGGVHIGDFDGTAKPVGRLLAFGDGYDGSKTPSDVKSDNCLVRLNLFGDYLMAEDNNNCGGLNVSFMGVYRRSGR